MRRNRNNLKDRMSAWKRWYAGRKRKRTTLHSMGCQFSPCHHSSTHQRVLGFRLHGGGKNKTDKPLPGVPYHSQQGLVEARSVTVKGVTVGC